MFRPTARRRRQGRRRVHGRTDYQVKIRGYWVELQAIESALLQVSSVAAAVVIAAQAPHGDDELVAYWVPKSVCGEDGLDLRAHLRRTLPDYMVPSWFVPMASLPRTPNGKIDRRALPPSHRTAEEARVVRTETGEAAVTPVEDMLLGIWADVLGVKTVRRHDDFFELGGHSLLAARLMQQLSESFWIELPLRTLFESPTVAALAPIILERLEAKRLQEVTHRLVGSGAQRARGPSAILLSPRGDAGRWLLLLQPRASSWRGSADVRARARSAWMAPPYRRRSS